MRFTQTVLAALSAAAAQAVIITNADFSALAVGTPFVITFAESVGPTTVYLATGTPDNVITGAAIGSAAGASGSITFTPTSGGSFALKIVDSGSPDSAVNPNYSGFFNVAGAVVDSSSTTTTTALTTTTAAVQSSTTMMPTTMTMMTTAPVKNGTTMMTSTSTMGHSNSTTSATGSSTKTSSSSTGGSTGVPDQLTSGAAGFASPMAFVVLAFGALLTLN